MKLDELAQNDGQDGRRAYVAVNGTIYDVTNSPLWKGGLHPPDHRAGGDLTEELQSAPHVRAVVERFPVVGQLETEAPASDRSGAGKGVLLLILAAVILGVILLLVL
ncbi:MAG TPA: cytochrome b5 domain-containing protein [Desulfuromonadales bacterium]|nr:cytochrome b5 domain-containing protein [Desulfuromonadales bacterium]